MKETERVQAGPGPGRGPFGGGMVGQKSLDFGPSARRLIGRMRPERGKAITAILLAVLSVALASVGPKILGRATDLIFSGLFGRRIPAGVTKQEAVQGLRDQGEGRLADMLSRMDVVPGQGVDFTAVRDVLLLVLAVYVAASVLSWLQGYLLNDVVQSTVRRMRADVEDKINRLPLRYFDRQPRGELLSRVTNDIDNISQTLQQTMSQLLYALLTVVGVLAMMFWISPVLALVALVTVPVTMLVTGPIMKRSQGLFIAQWRRTGKLNAHIEEAFTGHALVKVFGRQREVEEVFAEENDALFEASFGAQFVSGLIMPTMMFIGNLNYVVIAVLGGLRVANGTMSLGDVQAFIQYSRQFTQPLTQVASMVNLLQSGVASAERVFELLDAEEEPVEEHAVPAEGGRGEVVFEHVSFRYEEDEPLIEDLSLVAQPGQTVAIVGPTGAGKTTLVNLVMRFYDVDAGRITLDGVDIASMRRSDLRSRIGMVLQDTWLFDGTIRDNIAYGRPGRHRGADPRRGPGHLRRPVRAQPARRLRHRRRRGGQQHQRGRAAAGHHRARLPGRPRAADPRRGDQLGRHPHRAAGAARDGGAAHGPDQLRDRAPALHDPRRRPDPGDGVRADRRAGHPRRAARRRRGLRRALQRPVLGGRDRRRGRSGAARGGLTRADVIRTGADPLGVYDVARQTGHGTQTTRGRCGSNRFSDGLSERPRAG